MNWLHPHLPYYLEQATLTCYYERRITKRDRKMGYPLPISQRDARNGLGAKKDDSIKSAVIFQYILSTP
jgi:hypothetical protein